jgi:hypothetical protein
MCSARVASTASYDFNDEVLPLGVAWFVAMAHLAISPTPIDAIEAFAL